VLFDRLDYLTRGEVMDHDSAVVVVARTDQEIVSDVVGWLDVHDSLGPIFVSEGDYFPWALEIA
jgi:hypothetical protein